MVRSRHVSSHFCDRRHLSLWVAGADRTCLYDTLEAPRRIETRFHQSTMYEDDVILRLHALLKAHTKISRKNDS